MQLETRNKEWQARGGERVRKEWMLCECNVLLYVRAVVGLAKQWHSRCLHTGPVHIIAGTQSDSTVLFDVCMLTNAMLKTHCTTRILSMRSILLHRHRRRPLLFAITL